MLPWCINILDVVSQYVDTKIVNMSIKNFIYFVSNVMLQTWFRLWMWWPIIINLHLSLPFARVSFSLHHHCLHKFEACIANTYLLHCFKPFPKLASQSIIIFHCLHKFEACIANTYLFHCFEPFAKLASQSIIIFLCLMLVVKL
jgi:hypothetical protein